MARPGKGEGYKQFSKVLFVERFTLNTEIMLVKLYNKYNNNLQSALDPSLVDGQLIPIIEVLTYFGHFKYRKEKHKLRFKLRIKYETSGGGG